MDKNKAKLDLPVVQLTYSQGDMIIKQGDYGASIYEIREGQVDIIREKDGQEEIIAVLGPGEIIGENAFMKGRCNARSASVRAKVDCVLDAWHPALLSSEYMQLSPVLKYILDRTFKRLVRMNKLISDMSCKSNDDKVGDLDETAPCREYYNKKVDLDCNYRPLNTLQRFSLKGKIIGISRNVAKLHVSYENVKVYKHENGDIINLNTVLPNKKQLELNAEIISIQKDSEGDMYTVELSFLQLTDHANKTLGFFLMP